MVPSFGACGRTGALKRLCHPYQYSVDGRSALRPYSAPKSWPSRSWRKFLRVFSNFTDVSPGEEACMSSVCSSWRPVFSSSSSRLVLWYPFGTASGTGTMSVKKHLEPPIPSASNALTHSYQRERWRSGACIEALVQRLVNVASHAPVALVQSCRSCYRLCFRHEVFLIT